MEWFAIGLLFLALGAVTYFVVNRLLDQERVLDDLRARVGRVESLAGGLTPGDERMRRTEERVRDLDAALRLGTTDPTGARGYVEPRGYLEGNVQAWKRAYDEQQAQLGAGKDA